MYHHWKCVYHIWYRHILHVYINISIPFNRKFVPRYYLVGLNIEIAQDVYKTKSEFEQYIKNEP